MVRAILIYGQADFFSVGTELEHLTQTDYQKEDLPFRIFANALLQCHKPIIAAVNGMAIGAAASMLLHCDFVYAADTASFAFPFATLGMVPDFAASYLLPAKVGFARANEMLLMGQPFGAQDALESGFVNGVLPESEVLNYARGIAERFNRLPPLAVQATKKLLRSSLRSRMNAAFDAEAAALQEQVKGAEVKEVVSAFLEKRWPDFSFLREKSCTCSSFFMCREMTSES